MVVMSLFVVLWFSRVLTGVLAIITCATAVGVLVSCKILLIAQGGKAVLQPPRWYAGLTVGEASAVAQVSFRQKCTSPRVCVLLVTCLRAWRD